MNKMIKNEIMMNLIHIKYRSILTVKLIYRYFAKKVIRTSKHSYEEYDKFWDDFWSKGEYLKTHYPFMNNGKMIVPAISPLEFKKKVIVQIVAQKIKEKNFKKVLEIGSGAGLNLLFLAPLFPDVKFIGLEPTSSGVRVSNDFFANPPKDFYDRTPPLYGNATVIQGSILDDKMISKLNTEKFDFIFSCAVFEQMNNYIELLFDNVFSLSASNFLFYEEWLEANSTNIKHYKTLVEADYFRLSISYLNKFEFSNIKFEIPMLQPSWLQYGVVYCEK